jgi:fluoroacetyl-CoA thioesterase
VPERPTLGETVEHRVEVTPEMTARLFGREVHPLYATAWMVRHAEEAGRLLVERHLAPEEDATGYSIALTHERPVPIGTPLVVRATVIAVDDRRCTTEIEVNAPFGVVGRGTFVQRYVPRGWLPEGAQERGPADRRED